MMPDKRTSEILVTGTGENPEELILSWVLKANKTARSKMNSWVFRQLLEVYGAVVVAWKNLM